MKLKCSIKGQEYDIVQGAYFSEEYNETLDSGAIIIDQVPKINDLKPYDDVFIYDGDVYNKNNPFNGYGWFKSISGNSSQYIRLKTYKQIMFVEPEDFIVFYFEKDFYNQIKNNEILQMKLTIKIPYYMSNDANNPDNPLIANECFYIEGNTLKPAFNNKILLFDVVIDNSWLEGTDDFYKTYNITREDWQFGYMDKPHPVLYDEGTEQDPTVIPDYSVFLWASYFEIIEHTGFYKHLLIDQFSEERLNPIENIFKYKIELFSETKKLEAVQLPNRSITEPLNIDKKQSIWFLLNAYVDQYTPTKKIQMGTYVSPHFSYQEEKSYIIWGDVPKYKISPSLKSIFENVFSPDLTLNLPNLKDIISRLMQVKDMIPYVKDDVIYALEYTKRNGQFNTDNVISITSSMTSSNFCNNLKTNYSNALSEQNSARIIDRIGFRDRNNSLLSLDNLKIETRYPIYKINNVSLCYYKNIRLTDVEDHNNTILNYPFLCKQDITKLVVLDTSRNLLSQQWDELQDLLDSDNEETVTLDQLAEYQMMTVGYSIGSNEIGGWGTKYTIANLNNPDYPYWWKWEQTYIQNMLSFLDKRYSLGRQIESVISINNKNYFLSALPGDLLGDNGNIIITDVDIDGESVGSDISEQIKSVFFEIDYTAFYNGSIIHSKDQILEDDIVINDNSSSSLILLEQEGIHQKTKANRFGNRTYNIAARYGGTYNDFLATNVLGSIYQENIKYDSTDYYGNDDIIIYHRDYVIFDNFINMNYIGAESAVLKNYFYNVYAKHRTWNLMPYEESVNRAENKKCFILLSKQRSYLQNFDHKEVQFFCFSEENLALPFLNFFIPNDVVSTIGENNKDDYNFSAVVIQNSDGHYELYGSDTNMFFSGNSYCINVKMYDNAAGGIYFTKLSPDINFFVFSDQAVQDDYKGTSQGHYIVVNEETGFIKKMGFLFGKLNKNGIINTLEKINPDDSNDFQTLINDLYIKYLFKLPQINLISEKNGHLKSNNLLSISTDTLSDFFHNVILYMDDINKDNKEIIDMTLQTEVITDSDDIIISPWLLRLSEINGKYNKISHTYYSNDIIVANGLAITLTSEFKCVYDNQYGDTSADSAINFKIGIDSNQQTFLESIGEIQINNSLYFGFNLYDNPIKLYRGISDSEYQTMMSDVFIEKIKFYQEITQEHYIDIFVNIEEIIGKLDYRWEQWIMGGMMSPGYAYFEKNYMQTKSIGRNIKITLIQTENTGGRVLYQAYFIDLQNANDIYYPHFTIRPAVQDGYIYKINTIPDLEPKTSLPGILQAEAKTIKDSLMPTLQNISYYYPFPQNIFVGLYSNKINKNFIYEKYSDENILSLYPNISVDSLMSFDKFNNAPVIHIDLTSLQELDERPHSLIIWYYDNEDSIKDFYDLKNISPLSTQSVNEQNITTESVSSPFIYEFEKQYTDFEVISGKEEKVRFINLKINTEHCELNSLSYTFDSFGVVSGFKFVVYSASLITELSYDVTFFLGEEKLINGSYNFVFGVNISDQDWSRGYINIYYSLLYNKNTKVYNDSNQVIGTIHNYASDGAMEFPSIESDGYLNLANPDDYIPALVIPVLNVDDELIYWNSIPYASSYNVYIDYGTQSQQLIQTEEAYINIESLDIPSGTHNVRVAAMSDNLEQYTSSNLSEPIIIQIN